MNAITPLAAADAAIRTVAPLWPLKHFVAVNPYLGLTDQAFEAGLAKMAMLSGARPTLPRSFYLGAIAEGRITEDDLAKALAEARLDVSPAALVRTAKAEAPAIETLPTAARALGPHWPSFTVDYLSSFAAACFDTRQAGWGAGLTGGGLYAAWRADAINDPSPEIAGLNGARAAFAALPETAAEMIHHAYGALDLSPAAWGHYTARLALTMPGWSGYARYLVWQAELHGGQSEVGQEWMAILLAWETVLHQHLPEGAWSNVAQALDTAEAADFETDMVLQAAFEASWQRGLIEAFASGSTPPPAPTRAPVQAAFCIDVRSEVFRRALEAVDGRIETIGFAGFFGAAISYAPLGHDHAGDQCPVLLTPGYRIAEAAAAADTGPARRATLKTTSAWGAFRQAAVSSFAYVEAIGLGFGVKLAGQAAGLKGSAWNVRGAGLSADAAQGLAPVIDAANGTGIPVEDRVGMAKGILAGMSLKGEIARIVMLAGHGSTTANNPHATGLDCGACGGHTGEANARVACAVLNDAGVRAALTAEGAGVPDDTIFVPALHDTTTDAVTLFDTEPFLASHGADLDALEAKLAEAGALARAERAGALATDVDTVAARAQDWSQVRPEWGLAGCAAFVAAPRHRSAGRDLGGRAFLHSYEWQADKGFGVLELIMTAPLVVASWINLQYYGSTVDNRVLGSGNKVLHNVVGGDLGVLEGNAGDLRPGLPWQSVHSGAAYVHEPLRLNAVIEAPIDAMNAVIAGNEGLRALVDNGWVHLFQMDETGRIANRYTGEGVWAPVGEHAGMAVAA
ncbi:MAG: DUF2309 domain-containing protein [Pseudomonadota bacterium]